MKSETFDRIIRIERATKAQDDTGQEVETWAEFATVQASKKDVSDSERVAAAEVQASITTRFVTRWSPTLDSVNPKDRLVCEDLRYTIEGRKEIGRREGIEFSTSARAD